MTFKNLETTAKQIEANKENQSFINDDENSNDKYKKLHDLIHDLKNTIGCNYYLTLYNWTKEGIVSEADFKSIIDWIKEYNEEQIRLDTWD